MCLASVSAMVFLLTNFAYPGAQGQVLDSLQLELQGTHSNFRGFVDAAILGQLRFLTPERSLQIQGDALSATERPFASTSRADELRQEVNPSGRGVAKSDEAAARAAREYFSRGKKQQEKNDCASAIAEYDRAIASAPTFVEAYYLRGLCYITTNVDMAIRDMTRVIELTANADDAYFAYDMRAGLLGSLGRTDEALADYDRAISILPEEALSSFYGKAALLERAGRFSDAIAAYRAFLAARPHFKANAKPVRAYPAREAAGGAVAGAVGGGIIGGLAGLGLVSLKPLLPLWQPSGPTERRFRQKATERIAALQEMEAALEEVARVPEKGVLGVGMARTLAFAVLLRDHIVIMGPTDVNDKCLMVAVDKPGAPGGRQLAAVMIGNSAVEALREQSWDELMVTIESCPPIAAGAKNRLFEGIDFGVSREQLRARLVDRAICLWEDEEKLAMFGKWPTGLGVQLFVFAKNKLVVVTSGLVGVK